MNPNWGADVSQENGAAAETVTVAGTDVEAKTRMGAVVVVACRLEARAAEPVALPRVAHV